MAEDSSSPSKEGKKHFYDWLKSCSLEKSYEAFTAIGISEIGHLEDVREEDSVALRLSHIEFRRLTRKYGEYKQEQARKSSVQEKVPPTAFRPSSISTVVALPKGMKDFFQTRDGLGNVLVSTNSLKRQFKSLYYEKPINPAQQFSNSFVLTMAAERLKYSNTMRECELWCRKERAKRNELLIAFAKSPVIDKWTPYYKKQSVYGLIQINELKYPEIVALKSSSSAPRHSHYENLCKFVEGYEDALGMAKEKLVKCKQEMEATLKDGSTGKQIREGLKETNQFYQGLIPQAEKVIEEVTQIYKEYQYIVEKYRSKYGSSVGQQVLRRKRKKNSLKENKEKQNRKFQADQTLQEKVEEQQASQSSSGEEWDTEKEPEGGQEKEKRRKEEEEKEVEQQAEKEPEGRQETEKKRKEEEEKEVEQKAEKEPEGRQEKEKRRKEEEIEQQACQASSDEDWETEEELEDCFL